VRLVFEDFFYNQQGKKFCLLKIHPDQLLGQTIVLFIGYCVSLPGIKWLGCEVSHLPPSSIEVKNV